MKNQKDIFGAAMGDIDLRYLASVEDAPASVKKPRVLRAALIAAAVLSLLILGMVTGIALQKPTSPAPTDPVSGETSETENPGVFWAYAGSEIAEDPCAGKEHDFSIIEEVSTGRIIARCAKCGIQKNLYDEVDESEYDCDESHFTYLEYDEYSNDYYGRLDGSKDTPIIRGSTSLGEEFKAYTYQKVENGIIYEWDIDNSHIIGEGHLPQYYVKGTVGGIMITGYTGNATKVKVPASIDGKPVNIVDMVENVHNDTITSIIFSENIRWIRGATGYDWKNLETVYFSGGLTQIGGYSSPALHPDCLIVDAVNDKGEKFAADFAGFHATPFMACDKLKNVYYPDGLVVIDHAAPFFGCENIVFYYIPGTTGYIEALVGSENFTYYVSPENRHYCNVMTADIHGDKSPIECYPADKSAIDKFYFGGKTHYDMPDTAEVPM